MLRFSTLLTLRNLPRLRDRVTAVTAQKPVARRPRGRPRSAEADRAILDATLGLLIDVGFRGLTVEGVAKRARVAKTTIYRRWPSKEALVSGALDELAADARLPTTGSTREALTVLLQDALRAAMHSPVGRVFPRLAAEIAAAPTLFSHYQTALLAPRRKALARLVELGKERGELRDDLDIDIVIDVMAGPLFYHLMLSPASNALPSDLSERLVSAVWHGIGRRSEQTEQPANPA
ncbi:MAG: TetR/AcrR family transcriptional regulator [Chloroflexi bacterium]|nr:TetR/AcrR family transcriptional regulator [Chloroflexota bacterium]